LPEKGLVTDALLVTEIKICLFSVLLMMFLLFLAKYYSNLFGSGSSRLG